MGFIDNELLLKIIELTVLLITAWIGRYAIPYLKSRINSNQLATLSEWTVIFVNCAEMITLGEKTGKEKLSYVTSLLTEKANELNISVSEDDIRSLIEHAVFYMKKDNK